MRSGRLLGRDHTRLGAVEALAEGETAIALSKGGAAKTYAHMDPNEDAVGFATGAGGTLLAVADGHHGAWGAELAIEFLLTEIAPAWTGEVAPAADDEGLLALGSRALLAANEALLTASRTRRIEAAHTTLSFALFRPDRDHWLHASMGDSHVFAVESGDTRDLAWSSLDRSRCFYLGYPVGKRSAIELTHVGLAPRAGVEAIVLCTDGLSEERIGVADPAAAVADAAAQARRELAGRRPLELCKQVVHRALAAQRHNRAGDNIGAAVLRFEA